MKWIMKNCAQIIQRKMSIAFGQFKFQKLFFIIAFLTSTVLKSTPRYKVHTEEQRLWPLNGLIAKWNVIEIINIIKVIWALTSREFPYPLESSVKTCTNIHYWRMIVSVHFFPYRCCRMIGVHRARVCNVALFFSIDLHKVRQYFCTIYESNWNLSGNWTNLAFPFANIPLKICYMHKQVIWFDIWAVHNAHTHTHEHTKQQ